ncbi:Acetate permease A [Salinomyces thailandicus]|uniref:Acetate permease A n=1 Tax=Salinomyces thailandicus TaxID=706561 RepID=A0A4U0TN76_9PEZI|nr:Acetate permease A [Salinomyces thailandica]
MATAQEQNATNAAMMEKDPHGIDHANGVSARRPYDYGGNPLAHINTGESVRLPAFGGEFQPGLYRSTEQRKFANPAPLGLAAFALTTFVLSLINLGTRGISGPSIVIGPAFGYGGLVQLLAGMWEMAVGNTFGATALSSYGGFWIGTAIILTPGGFNIIEDLTADSGSELAFFNSFGLYLMGWFIFTFLLLICTVRSTVAFFLLFFTLDMAFLLLGIGYLVNGGEAAGANAAPQEGCIIAGGAFGILAAFIAWYNALAGIADPSNSFFLIPVAHFPWSEKGREQRNKVNNDAARAEQSV